MKRYLPLVCLSLTHALVDTCSLLVAPLWPRLQTTFGLTVAGLSIAFIVQSLPTSVSQAFFGYWRDRRPDPKWLWLGPVLAAVFLTLLGYVSSVAALYVLLIVGGLGIGAFHPEATVAAGRLMPEHRTRAISLFLVGGSLGLALGPTLSGLVVSQWGLRGLALLMPIMLLLIVILRRVGGFADIARSAHASHRVATGPLLSGRAGWGIALLVVCSLRIVPNMAMDKIISFVFEQRGYNETEIGLVQSLFLVAASAGMFAMAFKFRAGWEKACMIFCPLAGVPLLALMGWSNVPSWLFIALLIPCGFLMWGTTPAMVSYAQALFPNAKGFASAIAMGISWGLGGLIHAPITAQFQASGQPQHAMLAFIPLVLVSVVGACLLPNVHHEPAEDVSVRSVPEQPVGSEPEIPLVDAASV